MRLSEARSSVARLNQRLLESGLAIATNPVIEIDLGPRVRLSWPEARTGGVFTDEQFASLSEYRRFVTGRHYTCLLNDGGLIQVSFDFLRDDLVGSRYCFYPCPLELSEGSFPGDLEVWEDMLASDLLRQISATSTTVGDDKVEDLGVDDLLRLRSPFRFDFESEAPAPNEPVSHVHINGSDARIPVHAGLSLAEFMRFVIGHYYPKHKKVLAGLGQEFFGRCISASDASRLHFNSQRDI